MEKNWVQSPIKHRQQSLNASTQIIQLTSYFQIGGSANTILEQTERKSTSFTRQNSKSQSAVAFVSLVKKKIYEAFQRIRRRTLKTETDGVNQNNQIFSNKEEGLAQLDHFFKSEYQKNKVMAFTFIRNFYRQFKRKQQKRLRIATLKLNELLSRKQKQARHTTFNKIMRYAICKNRLIDYRFAFKSINGLLQNISSRHKKTGFENILRKALFSIKADQKPILEPPQHIYLVNQHKESYHSYGRKSKDKIYLKVPKLSQRVYLQQYNITTKKKQRSLSNVRTHVKISSCSYCSYQRRCKYCDILKVLNV